MRADGKANGKPLGVLAIHFDWESQARAIVQGVRVGAADRARVLLVDSNLRVIAASDGQGLLSERVTLALDGQRSGFYHDRSGALVAFHATPGYETYKGLGWYGVILAAAMQRSFTYWASETRLLAPGKSAAVSNAINRSHRRLRIATLLLPVDRREHNPAAKLRTERRRAC